MNITPLDLAINNSLYSRIYATPLNDRMQFFMQKMCGSALGKPHFYAVVVSSFTASLLTSSVALIETISSLSYAALATLVHVLTICKSLDWQNHVIQSWAFCKHSALGVAAPLWIIKYRNMNLYEMIQRRGFYKIECAQKMQKIGKIFDSIAYRIESLGEYKQHSLEIALEGVHQMMNKLKSCEPYLSGIETLKNLPKLNRVSFIDSLKRMGSDLVAKLTTIPETEPERKKLLEDILVGVSNIDIIEDKIYEVFNTKLNFFKASDYKLRQEKYIQASVEFVLSNDRYLNIIGCEDDEEGSDRKSVVKENIEELFLVHPISFLAVLLEVLDLQTIQSDQWGIESSERKEQMEELIKEYKNLQNNRDLQNLLLRLVLQENDFDIEKDFFLDKETNKKISIDHEVRENVLRFFRLISECAKPLHYLPNLNQIVRQVTHLHSE